MFTISAVLPVYNAQSYIAECIRSLQNQLYSAKEIIIIDDGSTDETANIIKTFVKDVDDLSLQVITFEQRQGAAKCRNIGNQIATGDIIAVCDVDFYHNSRFECINAFFEYCEENDVDKSVFYSAADLVNGKNIYDKSSQPVVIWDFKSKCTIMHPTVAYKREVALKHPYYELSKETDLFEFMLLDMHKDNVGFGCSDTPTILKVEGQQSRNKKVANDLKRNMYKKYGIKNVQLLDTYLGE